MELWCFQSCLSNRQQFVTHNGISSSAKTVKCGVPQGSIQGSLLFLKYIYSTLPSHIYIYIYIWLGNVFSYCLPILFADDTNRFVSVVDMSRINEIVAEELAELSQWLKVNILSLNLKRLSIGHSLEETRRIKESISNPTTRVFLKPIPGSFLGCIQITLWTAKRILVGLLAKFLVA